MDDPYRHLGNLPYTTLQLANHLDGGGAPLTDTDRLPIGVDTRFEAVVRLLLDLEIHREIDVLSVLLSVDGWRHLSTEDVERALQREAKLKKANESDTANGGRPSKVEAVTSRILSICNTADEGRYVGEQATTRDNMIYNTLRDADISRRTFYRIRDRVQEEVDVDITDIHPPSELAD